MFFLLDPFWAQNLRHARIECNSQTHNRPQAAVRQAEVNIDSQLNRSTDRRLPSPKGSPGFHVSRAATSLPWPIRSGVFPGRAVLVFAGLGRNGRFGAGAAEGSYGVSVVASIGSSVWRMLSS